MRQQSERGVSYISHGLEIAVAVGVLAMVVIPAVWLPAMRDPGQPGWEDSGPYADSTEGEAFSSPAIAPEQRFVRPARKDAPPVSAEFAIASIRGLSDRFDFARQQATARAHVTDADVAELVRLAQMGEVAETGVRAEELVFWDWLVHVDSVSLADTRITDASLVEIARLPGLTELELSSTDITDRGLRHLRGLNRLSMLFLDGTRVSDEALSEVLPGFLDLEVLNLSGTAAGDKTLFRLASLGGMESLIVGNTRVTSASLASIARLSSLECLALDGCAIGNRDIEQLLDLQSLRSLSLRNTRVTDSAAETLVEFPHLVELDLSGTNVSSQTRAQLCALMSDCTVVGD
jgi:Leucine-rich repeat (LRR) protein